MHVLILITDVELSVNDFNTTSLHFQNERIVVNGVQIMEDWIDHKDNLDAIRPSGSSKVDQTLNDKMVQFTQSKFPETNGTFSTKILNGPLVTFKVQRCYDIDNGLQLYGKDNEHILFVSGGVDVTKVGSLATISANIMANPNALAIGNIQYSKNIWFRIKQNLVYINIDNWKKAGQPWFGSWSNFTYVSDDEDIGLNQYVNLFIIDRNLPVVDRSYDSDQILRINNTGKREDIKMTIRRAPGWNFIDVAYKNNLEIGSWPYEIVKKWPWLYNEEAGTFQAKKLWIREDNDNS